MADSLLLIHNKVAAWDEVADSQLSPEHTIVFSGDRIDLNNSRNH